jgi:hypothetical protein
MARPTIHGTPMTPAERQRRRRERLRKEAPPMTDRQKLHIARAEIRRLRQQLAMR